MAGRYEATSATAVSRAATAAKVTGLVVQVGGAVAGQAARGEREGPMVGQGAEDRAVGQG